MYSKKTCYQKEQIVKEAGDFRTLNCKISFIFSFIHFLRSQTEMVKILIPVYLDLQYRKKFSLKPHVIKFAFIFCFLFFVFRRSKNCKHGAFNMKYGPFHRPIVSFSVPFLVGFDTWRQRRSDNTENRKRDRGEDPRCLSNLSSCFQDVIVPAFTFFAGEPL